jgi:hypothetical protein
VVLGAAVATGVLVLYIPTAARDLIFGDGPELTGAAITLGVAHPPGYPVWTMIAHLFTLLPVGTFSFRVSVFSVAAAAVCVGIVYLVAYRLSGSLVGAFAAAAMLALTPVFWRWSVVPEVFALNAALAAALIGLLVAWHMRQRPAYFIAAAFLGGIGLANQQTIGLLGRSAGCSAPAGSSPKRASRSSPDCCRTPISPWPHRASRHGTGAKSRRSATSGPTCSGPRSAPANLSAASCSKGAPPATGSCSSAPRSTWRGRS